MSRVEVKNGTVTISNETLIVSNSHHGTDYAIYAPDGSVWSQSGNVYTSNLNGKNYWSAVMLPQNNTNTNSLASSYKKYAYVFPENTEASWIYNESNSSLKTQFNVSVSVKEGSNNNILQGLLPHQWYNLSQDSPIPNIDSYESIRGELKMLDGNFFEVENTFLGILPTLPYLANYSDTFSPSELEEKINLIENDGLAEWTDSYNEGQMMNRLIQTARIANKTNDIEALDKIINTIKNRLEDWLTYQSNEVAFLFYYNQDWTTLLGYPAGHGQDSNINDHHFHWGYFIHAAAFVEQFEPGWADEWGDMIDMLIRDAASPNRNDNLFPFLRKNIPHQVLNAKQHEREAEVIANAGKPGVVTIATNMAGRGTDIVLGGKKEDNKEWESNHQTVLDAGGLCILGTERHESRRIDNQLRGRSGRQGDPGSSQFFLSLEDDLFF